MTRTNIETHIEPADEARVAPAHWKRALLAVLGIVTFWAWLLTQPPYYWSDSAAAGWWLVALLAGAPWAWMVMWNTHRQLLALTGLALPVVMVVIAWQTLELRSALGMDVVADRAAPAAGSWLWGWAGWLGGAPLLVILGASWRAGQLQVRRTTLRQRAMARAAREREEAERQEAQATEQAEQDRVLQRQQREELIEEATSRLAARVAGGGGGDDADTDELAALLALFQDRERRCWRQEAAELLERAENAESRLATKDEEIRKLRGWLRQELAYDLLSPVVAMAAGAVSAVGTAGLAGGAFAGDRVANAWNKSSGG